MNYIKPEDIKEYVSKNPEGIAGMSEGLAAMVNHFAELIVRECANHCDLLLDHKISSEWSRGTHDCSRAIKKHFGVEL
jgi:hypothetical protein